jgi:RNA polymerase sigma-70 factor (ECF subfamily)
VRQPSEHEIAAWYPRLFRTALRLTGSADDAADLTQQALVQALGAWDRFDGGALPTTWLHRILVNCVRDWSRRRAVRSAQPAGEWDLATVAADSPDGREQLEHREQLAALRRAIEALPVDFRTALVATVIDGYTYQEAAELFHAPVGTIASRVSQARVRLKAAMSGDLAED